MQFIKIGDQYVNMSLVKYVNLVGDGLEVYTENDIIPVSGDSAKYLREVLDGAHAAAVAEINRKLPVQGSNK